MDALIPIVIGIICVWYYIIPFAYTWLGWNFFLTMFFSISLLLNFTITLSLLGIYILTPKKIIDECLQYIVLNIRILNKDFFDKLEANIRKTFQIKILYPIPERSIRIWNPHGVNAVSVGIHNGFRITDSKLPKSKIVTHTGAQYFPIFSDILRQIHCITSDYHEIQETLKTQSVTVVLGGVNEMRRVRTKQLELVIRKRKGMFKLALESGTPIVPVITYGENEIFPETDDVFLCWTNKILYDNFKIGIPFPSYTSMINWANLTSRPLDTILTYTGRPIYVKKIENPTDVHVRILRNIYIRRVRELFEKTNPGEFSLKIV